jgi:hypothetical protein
MVKPGLHRVGPQGSQHLTAAVMPQSTLYESYTVYRCREGRVHTYGSPPRTPPGRVSSPGSRLGDPCRARPTGHRFSHLEHCGRHVLPCPVLALWLNLPERAGGISHGHHDSVTRDTTGRTTQRV